MIKKSKYNLYQQYISGQFKDLTKCELIVLMGLWNYGLPTTAGSLTNYLNVTFNKNWKPQTIHTFLTRLFKKGYVSYGACAKYHTYTWSFVISKQIYRDWMTIDLISNYFTDITEFLKVVSSLESEYMIDFKNNDK